jgi:molybdopterin-guanine dinucleotide biosynthesis protein A
MEGVAPLRAGFVLTGGASSRMGCNKALLPFRGGTLAAHIASELALVCDEIASIGASDIGVPVLPDRYPGEGPLGGILTALQNTKALRSLVVACDMPGVDHTLFGEIFEAAERSGSACLLPVGPEGRRQPLCAVYHRDTLPLLQNAFDRGVRKVTDALAGLDICEWRVPGGNFTNVNTPDEWASWIT